ncbi:IclR family transcriptional regulator [Roseomonas elaeocarpi]|uniref:IclR family transcriptional regulator n=1 Tax=Roseomonas elaeocarpi TaxID=907779 RepID=A0ABV6JN98_9PROT
MATTPKQRSAPTEAAEEDEDASSSYLVAAADRALRLLTLVGDTPGLGLSELARLSGNSKARTFRLLQTLEANGFVLRKGSEATYWLSYQALRLAARAEQQIDLVRLSQPVLDAIGPRCEETVQIRVRHELESLCLGKWETTRIIRYHATVGQTSPLYAGASKVLLAFAPEAVQQTVLDSPRQSFTEDTPTEASVLRRELALIRRNGHCISRGEVSPEAFSVGVPVTDAAGQVVAALLIAAPLVRAMGARAKELLALAEEGGRMLSQALGHRPD